MNLHPHPLTSRRDFIKVSTTAALGGAFALAVPTCLAATPAPPTAAAKAVKALYDTLSEEQKKEVCFDWDYRVDIKYGRKPLTIPDPNGVLLRAHVSNAWQITPHLLASPFYSDDQRALVMEILKAILEPGWPEKLVQQAEDDTGKPWGAVQSLAIFGTPESGKFQCVVTGFHLTLRAGSDPDAHAAFGGAITHGHQPTGFYEKVGHPGNIFWHQALVANKVYQILDGTQRKKALFTGPVPFPVPPGAPIRPLDQKLVDRTLVRSGLPRDDTREAEIRFRDPSQIPGLPLVDMSHDQKDAVQKVLQTLIAPYRPEYQAQVLACLKKQGGLDACRLAFYQHQDLGDDGEWDNWRLEGPSFVWFFRGAPHVHIWIHVADDPTVPVSSYFG